MRTSASSKSNVPAFSIRSAQAGTSVANPPRVNIFATKNVSSTAFRRSYDRGDLPVYIIHESRHHRLGWKVEPESLDYSHYLPLFLDGLCETKHPYEYFARKGAEELITRSPERVSALLPAVIPPIRRALNTRNPRVIGTALKIIQQIATCSRDCGRGMIPYYKALLPVLNIFRNRNSDGIDYSQQRGLNLGDLILETLEILERTGGSHAFALIKTMVPTYESCMRK